MNGRINRVVRLCVTITTCFLIVPKGLYKFYEMKFQISKFMPLSLCLLHPLREIKDNLPIEYFGCNLYHPVTVPLLRSWCEGS